MHRGLVLGLGARRYEQQVLVRPERGSRRIQGSSSHLHPNETPYSPDPESTPGGAPTAPWNCCNPGATLLTQALHAALAPNPSPGPCPLCNTRGMVHTGQATEKHLAWGPRGKPDSR